MLRFGQRMRFERLDDVVDRHPGRIRPCLLRSKNMLPEHDQSIQRYVVLAAGQLQAFLTINGLQGRVSEGGEEIRHQIKIFLVVLNDEYACCHGFLTPNARIGTAVLPPIFGAQALLEFVSGM